MIYFHHYGQLGSFLYSICFSMEVIAFTSLFIYLFIFFYIFFYCCPKCNQSILYIYIYIYILLNRESNTISVKIQLLPSTFSSSLFSFFSLLIQIVSYRVDYQYEKDNCIWFQSMYVWHDLAIV